LKRFVAAMVLALAACGQTTHLAVEKAEYRPPLGVTGIGVAYFSVTSDRTDKIIGLSSPQADRVEIHATVTDGAQMSMKRLDSVDLPAGQLVIFEPRGMHLMVFGPRPLAAGATFPIQIELESGRSETVEFHPALIGARDSQ
jgi:periplasmic copper chaperone A